jgi:uncharacterized repeat protein (TIGR01451 family)
MRLKCNPLLLALVLAFAVAAGALSTGARAAASLNVEFHEFNLDTFANPIGIDFYEPVAISGAGKLIVSDHYPNIPPVAGLEIFDLIEPDGRSYELAPYNAEGLIDEVKVATVREGACKGGFPVGDVFFGSGSPGSIGRLSANGEQNAWVTLPGETDHVRGSLYQDRACAFGGDLIVVTANEQTGDTVHDYHGNIWRVNSSGVATMVASIDRHLEGVITVPNDPIRYGPLAGRIVAGDEDLTSSGVGYGSNGRLWAVNPLDPMPVIVVGAPATADVVVNIAPGVDTTIPHGIIPVYPTNIRLHPEDLDLIPEKRPGFAAPEGDLFAIDFGGRRILRGLADGFAGSCGDILVTQEFPIRTGDPTTSNEGMSVLHWDGANFLSTPIITGPIDNELVGHFEHAAFWGGRDCTTTTNLTIAKTAANTPIKAGDTASFTITVTNPTGAGQTVATAVVLTDTLPPGLDWTVTPALSECLPITGGVLTCTLASLDVGASFAVTVTAPTSPDLCAVLYNTATVVGGNEDQTQLGDNSASASIEVGASHYRRPPKPRVEHKPKPRWHGHHLVQPPHETPGRQISRRRSAPDGPGHKEVDKHHGSPRGDDRETSRQR